MTKIIGYTTGVFDLFHHGHVNIFKRAKEECDHLIVGVSTDDLVKGYKDRLPLIPHEQRKEVVKACKYVDEVIDQKDMNKFGSWEVIKFDKMFVGDDWKGTEKWNKIEKQLKRVGAKVVYIPYTEGVSSTKIKEIIGTIVDEGKEENEK